MQTKAPLSNSFSANARPRPPADPKQQYNMTQTLADPKQQFNMTQTLADPKQQYNMTQTPSRPSTTI